MRRRSVTIGAMTGAMAALGVAAAAPSLGAQQQVQVIVTAVPNPVPAGSCTGIWVEVRDAANQRLNDLNGVPLHSRSYEYSIPNTSGFAWRDNDPSSGYLCAQVGVATVNIPVTATVRSTSYSGATIVTIQSGAPGQVAAANPPAGAGAPGAAAGAAQPGYGQPAGAAPAAAGAQPGYAPAAGGAAGAAQPAYGPQAGAAPSAGAGAAGGAVGAAAGAAGQPGYGQPAGAAPSAGAAPAGGAVGAAAGGAGQPGYGQPAGAAPSAGGAPAADAGAAASGAAGAAPAGYAQPAGAPQQAGYAPPPATANPYTPPQSPVPGQPYASQPSEAPAQAQPVAAAVQPVAAAPAEKKGGGGFLKKFGKHLKQRASEVTSQTAATLTSSATQLVDTTLQTGSGLVSGTVAGAGNAARMTIGGAGKSLLPSALRGPETSDNLASAVASGRAVLRAMRFTAGTAVLEPSSQELAVRLAGELKKVLLTSPGTYLIAVHVDPILTPAGAPIPSASQQLSEQRAATVKAVLVQNGVLPTQLIALGYGASQPLPETAPDGSSTSARVEIARTQ